MLISKIVNGIRWRLIALQEHSSWLTTWKALGDGKEPEVVKLRNGLILEAPAENNLSLIIHEIFHRKVYSPAFVKVEKGDTVVDIGGNIGSFSIYASSCEAKRVLAFEPFPENFSCILKNISINAIKNIEPQQAAVSDSDGTVRLFVSDVSGGHLLFDHNINGKLVNHIEVRSFTLAGIIDTFKLDRIDFLKIDCEGSEGAILRSTPLTYLQKVRKIALEFHDNVSEPQHDGLISLLEQAGFETKLDWNGSSPFGYIYARRNHD